MKKTVTIMSYSVNACEMDGTLGDLIADFKKARDDAAEQGLTDVRVETDVEQLEYDSSGTLYWNIKIVGEVTS